MKQGYGNSSSLLIANQLPSFNWISLYLTESRVDYVFKQIDSECILFFGEIVRATVDIFSVAKEGKKDLVFTNELEWLNRD